MRLVSWVLTSSFLCACVSTTSVVRVRFAKEYDCAEDAVAVDDDSATHYRARGCGKEAVYVCQSQAALRGGEPCVEEGLASPLGYHDPDRAVLPPPDPNVPPPR